MTAKHENSVESTLAELTAMDSASLALRWQAVFGCPAPHKSRSSLLRSALAWHCQMAHQAPSGPSGVDQLIRRLRRKAASTPTAGSIASGTRLLRQWQGQTHHVTVLVNGYEYKGKPFKSLTAIARLITGTAWSGPLFFGLRK